MIDIGREPKYKRLFIKFLHKEKCYNKFMVYSKLSETNLRVYLDMKFPQFFLTDAFIKANTIEGEDYWDRINLKWRVHCEKYFTKQQNKNLN